MLSAIHRNGKTQHVESNHIGCIRNVQPESCAHYWLAVHFCRRFALDKVRSLHMKSQHRCCC